MGSNKHKHKSRKRKHYRSSDSSERESERRDHEREKYRQHSNKKHKDRREKEASSSKTILVEDYVSSSSDDDVIIITAPPPPKISRRSSPPRKASPSPNRKKSSKNTYASPPPPPKISRHRSPTPPKSSRRRSLTPPPPKISRPRSPSPSTSPSENKTTSDASLSIEETNKLRIKLGLKPLSLGYEKPQNDDNKEKKETFGGVDMGDFVHKPPENIATKTQAEKIKEKIRLNRERRALEEKLRSMKKLGEADDDDDDVKKWVEKNRRIVSEKEQAEKRAKELDAMDEVFGIGELIQENIRATKQVAYSAKDLKGLKVEHDMDKFKEGRDVVLTLKDKGVLDEEGDTLVNVNILDDERYKKNIDRRRQKSGYNAYADELTEMESALDNKILSKYDEEIEGEKRASFTLGVSAQVVEEARRESIRNRLQEYAVGKRLENLSYALQPATEYYTDQELAVKFKKPKKRVRKIRKVKPLKADDLLTNAPPQPTRSALKLESRDEDTYISTRYVNGGGDARIKKKMKDEPLDDEFSLDTDDLPPPSLVDTSAIEIEDDDDMDLQLALHRSRKAQQVEFAASSIDVKVDRVDEDDEMGDSKVGGSIVLNSTAEFCRTLGDIPTYGQAGNRDEDEQELYDLEVQMKAERSRRECIDSLMNNWNEVEMDSTPVDITPTEAPILDAEPDISSGVAGALKMAICKGYIQTENEKRPSASRFAHLQAQNYSIEDKTFTMEDDKHSRRERYCGSTVDFKEKEGYKPNVKLEYIDDDGHRLSSKEAFRYLSHKFHGKGPGKNKIEKRMKKNEQEALMKQMSSTDTPLGTLNMLQQKQKETQSAFVILSGSKHSQSTNIAKMKL